VATEIFTLLGYKIEVKFVPCKRVLQYAKIGKTLGILACAYRRDRENFLISSDPISEFINGDYVRTDFDAPAAILFSYLKHQRCGACHWFR